MGDGQDHLQDLIRRARQRQVWHLLVHAASFGALIAIAGTILLLVLGAQILSWYWIMVLFVVGLAAGAYRLRMKVLSPYRLAQSIDHELGLKDALSTAYYFSQHPERADSPEFVRVQRQTAEELARSADVVRGMPFRRPRTAYVNLALVAVAFGMFGLRYGIHRSLDLGPPLVRVNLDGFFGTPREDADARHGKLPADGNGSRDSNAANDPSQVNPNASDPEANAALQSVQDPAASNGKTSPDSAAKADGKASEQIPPGADPLDAGEKGESSQQSEATNASNGADSKSGQQNGSNGPKDAKDASASQPGKSSDNSSLASKLRDALSNLMAKMNPQSKTGAAKPNDSSDSSNTRPSQQGEKQQGDAKSPGQEQAEASANSQEGEQQQGGAQQAQKGKSEGRNSNEPNSPDGKSGIGKQDGDKAAREAAELAAMGKLSEIIGKRAQNISGEVMVEVSPGKQQLKTQYAQQNATHSDRGSEIDRDEVPLAYQQYVQQYFTQIRKMPAAKAKSQPAAASDGKAKPAPSSAP